MIRKITLWVLFLILIIPKSYSQEGSETCEGDADDVALDLNSITKCTIKDAEGENKNKKVSFQVTSRRRLKRKRNTAQSIGSGGYSHQVADIKNTTNIVNNLSLKEVDASGVISFYKVDEIPLFKACKKVSIYEQQKCFKKQINRHVKLNLKYPEKSYKSGIQGRVLANFVIDKDGKVNITNTLFPYKGEELREEAKRIIEKLPPFIPGKQGNREVNVQYSLRVVFDIPGVKKTNIRKKNPVNEKIYDFYQLEKIPEFENCSDQTNSPTNCFINELQEHVTNNFAYPVVAIDNDIQGVVLVKFVINSEGRVTNISANGENNAGILEQAAKRLVQKLPVFKPAIKGGVAVSTRYEFPIEFSLQD